MKHGMLIALPVFVSFSSVSTYRLGEAERWKGAGALSGRYIPFSHHLSGLPHAHSTCPAGWGVRLRQAAASRHLAKPGFHGTAAAVWDWCSVSGIKAQIHLWNLTDSPASWHIALDSLHYQDSNHMHKCVVGTVEKFTLYIQRKAKCVAGITWLQSYFENAIF